MPITVTLPKGKEPQYDERTAIYREYMASSKWQEKRREALELANYTCAYCLRQAPSWPLEVHHLTYDRFGYEHVEHDLRVLCTECHGAVHSKELWPKILMMIRTYRARRSKNGREKDGTKAKGRSTKDSST